MDPYVIEKLVVLEMAFPISRERVNCWIGFLYGDGELDLYFRPYAEIIPVELNTQHVKLFKKEENIEYMSLGYIRPLTSQIKKNEPSRIKDWVTQKEKLRFNKYIINQTKR